MLRDAFNQFGHPRGPLSPLVSDDLGNTPLHVAVERRFGNCVRFLCDFGAVFGAVDKKGRSVLMIAAEVGGSMGNFCVSVAVRERGLNLDATVVLPNSCGTSLPAVSYTSVDRCC